MHDAHGDVIHYDYFKSGGFVLLYEYADVMICANRLGFAEREGARPPPYLTKTFAVYLRFLT